MRSSSRTLFGNSEDIFGGEELVTHLGPASNGKFCVLPSSLFPSQWLALQGGYVETREGPAKKTAFRAGCTTYADLTLWRAPTPTVPDFTPSILHDGKMQPRLVALFAFLAQTTQRDFCHRLLAPVTHTCWAASDAALSSRRWMSDQANTGMLGCNMPKLAANALLVHELALSAWAFRTFSAKEALWSLNFTIIFSLLTYSKRVLIT